jgi:hypothetical protein
MTCMSGPPTRAWPVKEMTVWFFFCFVFAMIPLLFAWSSDDMGQTKGGLLEVIERGDIYLICVALVGDSVGRFAMVDKKKVIDVVGLGFASTFAIMMAFEFGTLNSMLHAKLAPPEGLVWMHSFFYVISVLILGLGAVIRTED